MQRRPSLHSEGTLNAEFLSRAPPLCRSLPQSEYSHPPSYRSRTSSTRPTLDPNGASLGSVNHSRDPSLISHVSDQNGNVTQAVVNVISVMGKVIFLLLPRDDGKSATRFSGNDPCPTISFAENIRVCFHPRHSVRAHDIRPADLLLRKTLNTVLFPMQQTSPIVAL